MQVALAKLSVTQSKPSSRERLIDAAAQLFSAQGLVETTTRQIAELAGVNEVTLFRQFDSKYGLLLGLLQDDRIMQQWLDLVPYPGASGDAVAALQACIKERLNLLAQYPELTRSLVGEAANFSPDTRRALAKWLDGLNLRTSAAIAAAISSRPQASLLPPVQLATALNALVVGTVLTEMLTEEPNAELTDGTPWADGLDAIAPLFFPAVTSTVQAPQSSATLSEIPAPTVVRDLPAQAVRAILLRAKKAGVQDYAIAYVAFGAGTSVWELASLQRSHYLSDPRQHLLLVPSTPPRQVPIDRWIMEHRYGSYTRNPLTQWLKARQDEQLSLFINEAEEPASEADLRVRWRAITADLKTMTGEPIEIEHAQDTWRVEMLMKGMNRENLSILSGCDEGELEAYARRAQEKIALTRALEIDRKRSNSSD
ncbi:MAG: helix-turn-helix domain-containing protein [Cyanobacteria bacterium P01_D01_bin.123]